MFKISSRECQNLFLSLYFRDNTEVTQAVVTNVKANGFWVYVPRFDLRGAVYLRDLEGSLQIDPALVGLEETTGLPPSAGFTASGFSRRFPAGKCTLTNTADGDVLHVTLPESSQSFRVRTLDVVTIQIMCNDWDVKARIPLPRLHLISSMRSFRASGAKDSVPARLYRGQIHHALREHRPIPHARRGPTIYSEIMQLFCPPVIADGPVRLRHANSTPDPYDSNTRVPFPGRLVFGAFVNPDTRSATQEAAIEAAAEAAVYRREQLMSRRAQANEYDTSNKLVMNITSRTQRLAASKRNTRKAKAK